MYRAWGKRVLDFVAAGLAIVFFFPLMLVVSALSYAYLGPPAIFRQKRPGLNGKVFELVKFRTMRNDKDEQGRLLPDEVRLTKYGRILRSLSLDELPQLINVLKGEMSLVGPRPLLVQYLDRYTPEQARRHEVRPGITGWAQVNGRNAVSWDERFTMDVWYVENLSFALDVRIVLMTLAKVFKRSGVSAEGHVTMPEFMGSEIKPVEESR